MTTGVEGAGVGAGADLQPVVRVTPVNKSAKGATRYQRGATPHESEQSQAEG